MRLLQSLGATSTENDLVENLLGAAGSSSKLAAHCAFIDDLHSSQVSSGLRCVCGGKLERMNVEGRLKLYNPFLELDQGLLANLEALMQTAIICDLCDCTLTSQMRKYVYTCGNGERTILHPTFYDVCEDCFVNHSIV